MYVWSRSIVSDLNLLQRLPTLAFIEASLQCGLSYSVHIFSAKGLKPIDYRRRFYSYTLIIIIIIVVVVLFHICDQLCRDSVFVKHGAYEYV
jgi:NADH:ubiquinone oxidoreductase subunit 5 (subunit L)/multisubunit Na+/H+ antiporter MnhA subunit